MKRHIRLVTFSVLLIISSKVSAQIITTYAGNGIGGYSGDGGPADSAEIYLPWGSCFDDSGNFYFADELNNVIRKISTAGIITTIVGDGGSGYIGDGGPAAAAELAGPSDVYVDHYGNMYIADNANNRIRKVDTAGIITTVAGNGNGAGSTTGTYYSGDGGFADSAEINRPASVIVDASGNVYFSELFNNVIRKVNTAGIISTFAGTGVPGYSGDGGAAGSAQLNQPQGICFDKFGNVYVADMDNNVVRKINTIGTITTVAGNGMTPGFSGDSGLATAARLSIPWGVETDAIGNMYISDYGNYRIRIVDTTGHIFTFAGTGISGYTGDGGLAIDAEIWPRTITVDGVGNVYISDQLASCIRKVSGITGSSQLCIGSSFNFHDVIPGGTWISGAPAIASVSAAGIVTGVSPGNAIIGYAIGPDTATLSLTVGPDAGTIIGIDSICLGNEIIPYDTVTGGLWNITDTTVAILLGADTIKGVAAGYDTITYTVSDSGCSTTASFAFKVLSPAACAAEYVSPTPYAGNTAIHIYPNPSSGSFTISMPPTTDVSSITVTDIYGRVVTSKEAQANISSVGINLNIPHGNYFVRVQNINGSTVQKVVVE